MPDTVINRVNLLGQYQQDLLVFTDFKGWIIEDGDVDLTGVDEDGDKNEVFTKIENKNDINYQ